MKKTILLTAFIAIMAACSVPKTVIDSKKVLKGYWSLDEVTYNETGTYNIKLFRDTSKECFEGSTWRFISNNNSGTYTINNTDCPTTGDRNFIFAIQEMNKDTGLYDFLLKPTTKLGKPDKENSTGFRVRLAKLNENSMRWEQTVSVDGAPFTIYMNFSKIEQ